MKQYDTIDGTGSGYSDKADQPPEGPLIPIPDDIAKYIKSISHGTGGDCYIIAACEKLYRHLQAQPLSVLPPSPVGEAGWNDVSQDPEPYQSILVTNGATVHAGGYYAGGYYAENGKFCLNDGVEFEGGGKCCDLQENYVGWMPSPVGPAHKDSTKKPPLTPSRAGEAQLRDIISRADRYLREINDGEVDDPSVGLYRDQLLIQLIDDIEALPPSVPD